MSRNTRDFPDSDNRDPLTGSPGASRLAWERAKHAVRDAWNRVRAVF